MAVKNQNGGVHSGTMANSFLLFSITSAWFYTHPTEYNRSFSPMNIKLNARIIKLSFIIYIHGIVSQNIPAKINTYIPKQFTLCLHTITRFCMQNLHYICYNCTTYLYNTDNYI